MRFSAFYENIKLGAEKAGKTMEEALSYLKENGLTHIYANYEEFEKDLPEISTIMDKLGLGLEGFYAFLDMSHDPNEDKYQHVIDLCKEYGGHNVLLLPGIILPSEQERAEELIKNMIYGLSQAAVYAEGTGIDVTLEDFDGLVAPYNCISGMKRFMDETPQLKCSFDTGNFCMYSEDEMEAFHLLKPFLSTVHVKDRSTAPVNPGDEAKTCSDGTVVYPCPVGRGYIHLPEILAELKAEGYDSGLIAELYSTDPDCMLEEIKNSLQWLKAEMAK